MKRSILSAMVILLSALLIAEAQTFTDIVEMYPSGVNGGSIPGDTTGVYKRNLNRILGDANGIQLDTSTSRVLLPGGTWRISVSAPANVFGGRRTGVVIYYADTSQGIRYQWWGTSGAIYEVSEAAVPIVNARSYVVVPMLCVEAPTWIEVRQYAVATVLSTTNLGMATNDGWDEIYTTATFQRLQ